MAHKILTVDDSKVVRIMVTRALKPYDCVIVEAVNGAEGLEAAAREKPDLIILDVTMPVMTGLEMLTNLRLDPALKVIPVIMLTARGEEADRVRGLDGGVDDYVTKPFSPSELVARVRAVMRRARPATDAEHLTFADIVLDLTTYRVQRGGRSLHLGPTEFRLLRHFMEHPGRVYSREQLLDAVWGHNVYVESRTVDVHIRRLRLALNEGDAPDLIRTVRSAGYALDESFDHVTGN